MKFDLNSQDRHDTWKKVVEKLENFYENTESYKAATYPKRSTVLNSLVSDFDSSRSTIEAVDLVINGMSQYAVHTPHPGYYGMFNPRSNFPSIMADTITAVFNPQLAAWGHAPYAVEVENLLIREIGKKLGYDSLSIDGTFATAGQEANLTAVITALNDKIPNYAENGLSQVKGLPLIYCSTASHHSTIKAAKVCGLGSHSVRYIKVNDKHEMIARDLERQIAHDIEKGNVPFMIVSTMGTTGAGAIDPIGELAIIAKEYNLWLHADAAYGGGLALSEAYRKLLVDIHQADSITIDIHKWLSVPMATSMYITRHTSILGRTFSIKSDYMPEEESEIDRLSSYTHSIQWSRRFNGLKLYMPLLVFGWQGYDDTITYQIRMGKLLKKKLEVNNWKIYNNTELPILCFNDPKYIDNEEFSTYIYESFLETGEAWINKYPLGSKYTLRACITNYATTEKHLDKLISLLNSKRELYSKQRFPSI
ncbi:MAG: pyridoxal-dependent decarboxylase [Saprospiraceae bacterium]